MSTGIIVTLYYTCATSDELVSRTRLELRGSDLAGIIPARQNASAIR